MLVAFRDVEDQLSALRLLAEQAEAQARAVASAARTTSLSDARYRNGLVSQLDLLDARRSELRNRRQAAAGALRAVPGHRRPGARAGRRLGRILMGSRDDKGGPLFGLLLAAVAIVMLLMA